MENQFKSGGCGRRASCNQPVYPYADCRKGNRPSFVKAGAPQMAEKLYEHFLARCREQADVVEKGQFGADMKVELLNDGPFTLMLDSEELFK